MGGRSALRLRAILACPALLVGAAHAQPAGQPVTDIPDMAQLYQAAKAEGAVAFGGAIEDEPAQKLLKAFSERYPGIAVSYARRSTQPMMQLIEADRRASRVSFDVINVTEPGDLIRWTKEGFLAPVALPDVDQLNPQFYDPRGTFYALGVTPMYGIYNTNSLSADQAPRSLQQLLTDPMWKGKVAISRPTRGGTDTAALLNVVHAVGRDFIKTARDRDILLTLGNEAAISAVVSGERPVSWGVSGYRALRARARGAPVALIFWEEGLPLVQFMGAVPAKARHPNAARLLLRWLMTPEGQELVVKHADFYSPRKDVQATPQSEPPLAKIKINYFSNERMMTEGQALTVELDRALGLR